MKGFTISAFLLCSSFVFAQDSGHSMRSESNVLKPSALDRALINQRIDLRTYNERNNKIIDPRTQYPSSETDYEESRSFFRGNDKSHRIPSQLPDDPLCNDAAKNFDETSKASRADFIEHCLIDTAPNSGLAKDLIIKNMVFLTDGANAYPEVCTGLLVRKDTILTADHCSPQKAYLSDGSEKEILSTTHCDRLVNGLCDYALHSITQAEFEIANVRKGEPYVGMELLAPGYAVEDPKVPAVPPLKWQKENKSCLVEYLADGCVSHMCQVIDGFSGAPLLDLRSSVAEGVLVLIGMHTTSDIRRTACWKTIKEPYLNANFGLSFDSLSTAEIWR